MARIRSIKPEFWSDEKVMELSFPARLLFIGLWNFADREGRMVYSPKRIKALVFPGDSLEVGPLFEELKERGLITLYAASNASVLAISNWHKHQKPSSRELPSLLPSSACAGHCSGTAQDMQEVGRELGREVEVGREETSCVEAKIASPLAGSLPMLGGCVFQVTLEDEQEWQKLYPAANVRQEFRSMKGWLIANPKNQKTRSGMKRFINHWLQKAQNRAGITYGRTESKTERIKRILGNANGSQDHSSVGEF